MGDHRDDLMNSGDAAKARSLDIQAKSLGLSLHDYLDNCSPARRRVFITIGFDGPLLILKDFSYHAADFNVNVWVNKQLNDYQSWK